MEKTAKSPGSDNRPVAGHAGIILLIVAAVFLVFAPIIRHAFVGWDDDYTIQQNPRIAQPSLHHLAFYWRHGFMDLYIPVTYTVWTAIAFISKAFNSAFGPADPRAFHAASVVVHAINALLVFALIRRLFDNRWAAAGGALLFALHPVQVETVAWASGMKDLLYGMFCLLSLNFYVLAVKEKTGAQLIRSMPAPARRRVYYAICLAAMVLGTLSKPTAVVTPSLAVIIDLLILRRHWRRVLKSTWPLFLLAAPCLVWTKLCQPAVYLHGVALWRRPLIAADALAFYLVKLVLPIHLSFDYGRSPWAAFAGRWIWVSWTLPAIVAAALIYWRGRVMPLAAAALLLTAAVAPVLGLSGFDFQAISTVADHYLYLAMLGPAVAAAWVLARYDAGRRPCAATAVLILGLLAARSAAQAHYWRDSRTLFAHAIDVNPKSWSAWFGLAFVNHMEGRALAARATAEAYAGDRSTSDRASADELLSQALQYYRKAVELNPTNVAAHHGYAAMLMYFGRYRQAGDEFLQVIERREALAPEARSRWFADSDLLGQCLMFSGRPQAAARAFADAQRLVPPPPEAAAHLKMAQAAIAAQEARSSQATTDTQQEITEPAADGGSLGY